MKLTADEIKLVVFILLALTLGAATKSCRARERNAAPEHDAAFTTPAPAQAP